MAHNNKIIYHEGVQTIVKLPTVVVIIIVAICVAFLASPIIRNFFYKATNPSGHLLMPTRRAKATGPLFVDPDNPRYLTDGTVINGKYRAVLLAGSHTWCNLQDCGIDDPPPVFNYTAYLDFLQANNHNFMRLWNWEQAKWVAESLEPHYFYPLPYQRTGPGNALDGKLKFDLTKFEQAYFDRMRERVIEAGQRDIYVSIQLFDGWSVDPKLRWTSGKSFPWNGHPFNINNNINGINGDPNGDNSGIETEDLSIPEITSIQDAYVKKVVDTVNDLDNVLYEICNECATSTWQSSDSTKWQYHMIDLIHNYEAGKPKQHPVGLTQIGADDTNLFASNADWISIHDSGSLDSPYVANGSKVVIVDTDHICGICGDRRWVWKSFTQGKNPLFMDQYDDSYKLEGGGYDINNQNDVSLRLNLGYILTFANRINLVFMTPRPDLCSTGYCLANPVSTGAEYLVYLPMGGSVTVNMTAASGQLNYEWFNPADGSTVPGGSVAGGDSRSFSAPFGGDAVLYIYGEPPATQTPTATKTKTPLPPTATKSNTQISPTATRTNTPSGPIVTRTLTTTSTLDFSTPTPTSPLTFPTLTFTPPGGSTVTPSETGIVPSFTPLSTLTSRPVPPGGTSRTFLNWVVGILLTAAIIGVLFYLFWIFRQLHQPG